MRPVDIARVHDPGESVDPWDGRVQLVPDQAECSVGAQDPGELGAGPQGIAPVPCLRHGHDVEGRGGQPGGLSGAFGAPTRPGGGAELIEHVGGGVHGRPDPSRVPRSRAVNLPVPAPMSGASGRPAGMSQSAESGGVAGTDAVVVLAAVLEALPELLTAPGSLGPREFGATACHVPSPSAERYRYPSNLPHAERAGVPG